MLKSTKAYLSISVALLFGSTASTFAEWQAKQLPFTVTGQGATYGNGVFVVSTSDIETGSPLLKSSANLESWTDHSLSRTTGFPFVDFVDFKDGKFWLGMQAGGKGYLYSGAAPSSMAEKAVSALPLHVEKFGNQYVVAGGGGGTRNALTSPDGETWTARDLGDQAYIRGLASGNGLVVAVAPSNNNQQWLSFVSNDGETWQKHTHTPGVELGGKIVGLAFANGKFVALGGKFGAGPGIAQEIFSYVSTDGVTWTEHVLPGYYDANRIIATNNGFLAAAIKGVSTQTAHALTSEDGISWTDELIGEAFQIVSLFQAGDAFVAASYNTLFVKGDLPTGGTGYAAPWQDATDNGQGVANLPWFGDFVVYENNFIYHFEHGFFYTASTDTSSLWLYDFTMQDWLWTTEAIYPFLFSAGRNEWLYYFEGGNPDSRAFYGFTAEQAFLVP